MFYCLVSTSHSLSSGVFCAMDSGPNIFILLPVFAIPRPIAPSLSCLTSATSGPAHIPLHSAEVMVNMHNSVCAMRRLPQHAFIPAGLLFALYPLLSPPWVLLDVTLVSMMYIGYSVAQRSCFFL